MPRSNLDPQRILQEVYDEANRALRFTGDYLTEAEGNAAYQARASASGRFVRAVRTAGNIVLNGTSWADFDNALDLTLTGVTAGDIVAVSFSALWSGEAVAAAIDVVSVVSGNPVKNWSQGLAEDASGRGYSGWGVTAAAIGVPVGGTVSRAVEAGDLSAGSLTLRFRSRTVTAAAKTINGTSVLPIVVWAQNRG